MSIPQWKRDRCKWCAEGNKRIDNSFYGLRHIIVEGDSWDESEHVACTASTEAEYIAELESKLDFAHGRYQDLGQVSCDGFTAIAAALGLPASATPEQCVERVRELWKTAEALHLFAVEADAILTGEINRDWADFFGPAYEMLSHAKAKWAALDAARGEKP